MFQFVLIKLIVAHSLILTVKSAENNSQIVSSIVNQNEISSIVIVTRHGDRNVIKTYPTDPNEEFFRKAGFGEMRPEGCVRLYHAGRKLSTVLLPVVNERSKTYLRAASNPYPLVIESLDCFMAGINGPMAKINAKNDPPIDVPFAADQDDLVLNFGRVPCPVKNQETKNSVELKNMSTKYSEMLDTLQKGINSEGANVTLNLKRPDFEIIPVIISYTEPVVDESDMGLPRPPWVDDQFVEDAKRAGAEEFEILGKFPIQRKLSSYFVRELIKRLKETSNGLSFTGFASVSTSMVPMMITVGLWDGERPTYAEALIFIHRKDGRFEQYFYDKSFTLKQMKPEGCPAMNDCTLSQFEAKMKEHYVDDWKKECELEHK